MTYSCPKCGMPMQCISTASIPPIIRYECVCGYRSKIIKEKMWKMTLPEEYREKVDEQEETED